jgi:GTP-binding protein Era
MDTLESPAGFRSGFIAIAGRPNVGKSTLVNRLLQQQIAAVSPRPQTTRRKQLGILTLPDAQLIFVDTPGIHQPLHQLGERMNREALETLSDVDLILALFDLDQPPNEEDQQVVQAIRSLKEKPPLLGVLNKADLVPGDRLSERRAAYRTLLPEIDWITISAVDGQNMNALLENILAVLPEGPQYFPPDQITDTYERDISADLIRAAGMHYLQNEVPHSIAVRIDTYEERQDHGAYIEATLFVERESQKGIVIGKGGSMLKRIGTHARKEIEAVTGRKIFLRLRVKVLPGWRNDENALRQFGFQPSKDQ